jgi:PAS domain S-box-containing protein
MATSEKNTVAVNDRLTAELVEIMRFTEQVGTRLQDQMTEDGIYNTIKSEFGKSNKYTCSISLLESDKKNLRVVLQATNSRRIKAAEKASQMRLKRYAIDLGKSHIYFQVVRKRQTIHFSTKKIVEELFPAPLAIIISRLMGYSKKFSILTPLTLYGKTIGAFGMSAPILADHFIPSVKNLATHISLSLARANEYNKRKKAEGTLRKARDELKARVRERTSELAEINSMLTLELKERIQAEEALRDSRKRFQEMAELLPTMICEIGTDLRFNYVNKVGLDTFGYNQKDVEAGIKATKMFHSEERKRMLFRASQVLQGKKLTPTEYRMLKKDGTEIIVLLRSAPIIKEDEITGIRASIIDITYRKRAEEALRQSEEKWRSLVQNIPDTIINVAPDGTILTINRTVKGYTVKDTIGKRIYDFILPEHHQIVKDTLKRVLSTGKPDTYEILGAGANGPETAWYETRVVPVMHNNKITSTTLISTDITERKHAENSLKQAKEELEKQNRKLRIVDKIRDRLIRDVSHELKTPVAKYSMQLDLLKEFLEEKGLLRESKKLLDVIENTIKRQENVVRNILDLSSLEAGRKKYRIRAISVRKVINDAINFYKSTMESLGIQIKKKTDTVTIRSDHQMLFHVFSNIINNAIKYRNKTRPTRLNIQVSKKGGNSLVKISDNGIGLNKVEKARAFERFYQASASSEGSGIGLSIAQKIVENLGGKIWLESGGKGKGCTVFVQLPMHVPQKVESV